MIENELIYAFLFLGSSLGLICGFVRIFFPNYHVKRYIAKIDKPLRDNVVRLLGIVNIATFGYLLLWVLGYIK